MTTHLDGEESVWSEYAVTCSEGKNHGLGRPHRGEAMQMMAKLQYSPTCQGTHRILQRKVIRYAEPWGELLKADAQTEVAAAAREAAEKRSCPACKVGVGEPCINLTLWRTREEKKPTNWPHQQRLSLVED